MLSEAKSRLAGKMMSELIEQHRCPACDGAINREHVFTYFHPITPMYDGRRSTTIWCDHCAAAFSATFELSGGIWQQTGNPHRLTGHRLQAIKKKVSKISGDIQRQSFTPAA